MGSFESNALEAVSRVRKNHRSAPGSLAYLPVSFTMQTLVADLIRIGSEFTRREPSAAALLDDDGSRDERGGTDFKPAAQNRPSPPKVRIRLPPPWHKAGHVCRPSLRIEGTNGFLKH